VTSRLGALSAAFSAELFRRVRRAFLLSLGLAMLAVFALGASILPDAYATNLLLAYGVFLAVFGGALAVTLLRELGGPFGDALAVALWSRREAEQNRRAAGAGRILRNPEEARAWLAAHPGHGMPAARLSAHVMAGDLVAARATLDTYPIATTSDRFEILDDRWFLDFLEGGMPSLDPLEAAATEIEDPRERTFAAVMVATLRAHAAAASGADWVSPLAGERARVGDRAGGIVGARYVVVSWTLLMAIASALVGVALGVGRISGIWP
jgi:hypothetical protein